jgi:glutathione-regulated potassium-efflux system protein KefB
MPMDTSGSELVSAVALLGAAVVSVPIFKRIGLGSVVGYLAAGIAIGPFGFGLFREPDQVLAIAEFGVVLLLFVIGLELKPSRLWSLRADIFGLGAAQVIVCGALLMSAGMLVGLTPAVAFVAAAGLALSSTAIVMQILEERGETTETYGQKTFSILLLQDLAIVPLLAVLAVIAPFHIDHGTSRLAQIGIGAGAIVGVVAVGRYLLNPMFKLLASAQAREIMTAAALLVVLGAALAMQAGGLSMAMGAFIAGVLLSESSFRHQLEADIEPFRGLLLGLFFLAVGMSIDLAVIAERWPLVLGLVAVFMVIKSAGIYGVARLSRNTHADSLRLALMLAQGGEFAFVLFTTAQGLGLLDAGTAAVLTAAVIISMALTPLAPIALKRLLPEKPDSLDGIALPDGLTGSALVIGFGRFGQIACQALLARGIDVTIIDSDTEMIRVAARFGFQIYYGDGTRLDVLRAAGAGSAKIVAICVDKRGDADRIVELLKTTCPLAKVLVRSYDRGHTLDLITAGVDYQIRETFESALVFSEAALLALGVPETEAAEVVEGVRRRDAQRLEMQMVDGLQAGRDLMKHNVPTPTPLTPPKRRGRPLSEQTAVVAAGGDDADPAGSPD